MSDTLGAMVEAHYDNAYMMGLAGEIHFDLALSAAEVDMALAFHGRVRSGGLPEQVYLPCCGTLRHVPRLLVAGVQHVTGVDLSGESLARGRARFDLTDEPRLRVHRGDIRGTGAFVPRGGFPLLLLLGNSLGDVVDPDGHRAFLAALRRSLAPGGVLVFDYVGDRYLEGLGPGDTHTSEWPEVLSLSAHSERVTDRRTRTLTTLGPGVGVLHFTCEIIGEDGQTIHRHAYQKLCVSDDLLDLHCADAGLTLHRAGPVAALSEYHRRRDAEVGDLGMLGASDHLYWAEPLR